MSDAACSTPDGRSTTVRASRRQTRFERLHETTNFSVQRALEERLYNDVWGDVPVRVARSNGSMNRVRPIGTNNRLLPDYLDLAALHIELCT